MTSNIKVSKPDNEDNDVNPVSKAEIEIIIKAFEDSRYYKHYASYVKFLFYTGCRPFRSDRASTSIRLRVPRHSASLALGGIANRVLTSH